MEYEALLFDLFGTLIDGRGGAARGAFELLGAIAPDRWAIVTSCYDALARDLLAQAELPVPGVLVASNHVRANKPSPEGYVLAAHRLGRAPDSCLVFEDSRHGVMAALAAGMDVVAISPQRDRELMRLATYRVASIEAITITAAPDGRYRIDSLG
jgi:sugar-phosphatase